MGRCNTCHAHKYAHKGRKVGTVMKINVKYISVEVQYFFATYVPTGVTNIMASQEWVRGLWVIPPVYFTNDISAYADWGIDAVPTYAPAKGKE